MMMRQVRSTRVAAAAFLLLAVAMLCPAAEVPATIRPASPGQDTIAPALPPIARDVARLATAKPASLKGVTAFSVLPLASAPVSPSAALSETKTSDRWIDGQVTVPANPNPPVQSAPVAVKPAPLPANLPPLEDQAVAGPVVFHTDYHKAMKEAAESRKLLFIYFHEPVANAATKAFETIVLTDTAIREQLQRYVCLKLPRDASITLDGKKVRLLEHAAFAEMLGRQGVAIIDLAHVRADYYGHVVSTFPFTPGKYYRREALSIILDLPAGTLTQRTMIYAVRIHPEGPASTQGQFNPVLAEEAKKHSTNQANSLVQGHHNWDSRFHQINAQLGTLAQEVVAESWPNEGLVEACVDCVDSWRQSPGHWGAVRGRQPLFGYDIKRGRNGIWYATGIFGR